jgi:hypothetical protein
MACIYCRFGEKIAELMMTCTAIKGASANRRFPLEFVGHWFYRVVGFGGRALSAPVAELWTLGRKCPMEIHALNGAGAEFQLLTPFLEALLPAFEDRAYEIRIEPDASGLKLTYGHKSLSVPLPAYYGAIAFSRILIISEMSIALEGAEQTGLFRVRYNQQVIPIHVTSRRDKEGWFLIFRPNTALEPTATAPLVSTSK